MERQPGGGRLGFNSISGGKKKQEISRMFLLVVDVDLKYLKSSDRYVKKNLPKIGISVFIR